jgi:hypothetical protein
VTPSEFRAIYREFPSSISDSQIQTQLDYASILTDPVVWGDVTEQAIGLQAAHQLTIHPGGNAARLQAKEVATPYSELRASLLEARTSGLRVFL